MIRASVWLFLLACSSTESEVASIETVSDGSPSPDRFDAYLVHEGLWASANTQGIGEATLLDLLNEPGTRPLRSIFIRDQQMTAKAVGAIMTAPSTAELTHLSLSGNPIGDEGLEVLANSPRLSQIEYLTLQDVDASSHGIAALAASPHLNAKSLALGWQPVGDAGALALARASGFHDLRLESAQVGREGAVSLIEKGQMDSLSLISNPIHLVGLTSMSTSLQGLNLECSSLNDADIQALAQAPAPGLKSLQIKNASVSDIGLAAIQEAPWFHQLESLSISGQASSKSARKALIDAFKGDFLSIYKRDL